MILWVSMVNAGAAGGGGGGTEMRQLFPSDTVALLSPDKLCNCEPGTGSWQFGYRCWAGQYVQFKVFILKIVVMIMKMFQFSFPVINWQATKQGSKQKSQEQSRAGWAKQEEHGDVSGMAGCWMTIININKISNADKVPKEPENINIEKRQ